MEFIMDKVVCMICEKEISKNNTYLINHLRRKHNIELDEYVSKYFVDIGEYSKEEKCSFCDNNSKYKININHDTKEYYFDYNNGFFCGTDECKNQISLDFLGEKYNPFYFSKIGSKSEYLSKLHRISLEDAKSLKYNTPDPDKKFISNLNGFINKFGEKEGKERYYDRLRKVIKNLDPYAGLNSLDSFIEKYGIEEGKKRYEIRVDKIRKSNSRKWYIDKYGEKEGSEKWDSYLNKLRNHINSSDTSKRVTDFLNRNNINYNKEIKFEFNDGKYCFIDYYLPDFNVYIEYFGDYWHCNPSIYESNYYHQYINQCAIDIWNKDEIRLNRISKESDKSIIVIWESTEIEDKILINLILNSVNKKRIIKL